MRRPEPTYPVIFHRRVPGGPWLVVEGENATLTRELAMRRSRQLARALGGHVSATERPKDMITKSAVLAQARRSAAGRVWWRWGTDGAWTIAEYSDEEVTQLATRLRREFPVDLEQQGRHPWVSFPRVRRLFRKREHPLKVLRMALDLLADEGDLRRSRSGKRPRWRPQPHYVAERRAMMLATNPPEKTP